MWLKIYVSIALVFIVVGIIGALNTFFIYNELFMYFAGTVLLGILMLTGWTLVTAYKKYTFTNRGSSWVIEDKNCKSKEWNNTKD